MTNLIGAPAPSDEVQPQVIQLATLAQDDKLIGAHYAQHRTVRSNAKKQRKHIRLKGLPAIFEPFIRTFVKTRVNDLQPTSSDGSI